MSFWGLATTKPRCDLIAVDNLVAQEFIVYNPRIKERRVKSGRVIVKQAQLFPGYLFVLITDRFRCIAGTRGVHQLVMNGNHPSRVRDGEIQGIMQQEVDGFVVLPERNKFKLGQSVEATSGIMANRIGIYAGDRKHDRVKVLFQMLGRSAPVYVPEADLIEA